MEQKQLDEEDTFFGEEFIEDETSKEEIKVESLNEEKIKKNKKTSIKKEKTVKNIEEKVEEKVEDKVEIIPNDEKVNEPKEEVKTAVKETEKVEPVAPIDPWDDEEDEGGLFKNTSGWKLIAGILLVLLVASIYTNGFGMAGDSNSQGLSLSEAESKALGYVNENLLQAPFVAELESSEDVGNLYKVTLSVAGQTVDSYLTKDGNLFFPQGFETGGSVEGSVSDETELVEVSLDDDAVKGDANAPVTIVEFSDYECPFCGKYVQETYPSIVNEYINTGKVKYVFRDFPLSFHQNAQKASEAAECAGEQGKYWEMHDYLFANQDYLAVENLKGYAKDLGLDTAEFNDCLDSGKFADEVEADLLDGQAYGVSGTPAFFINGKLISGALPFAAFKAEIDAALATAGETVDEVAEEIDLGEEETSDLVLPVVEEPVVEEPVVEDVVEVKMVPVTAKKWMFGPNKIVVEKGNVVQLNIIPQGVEFTFAVPAFGIEQEITGATMVELTADKVGTFEFKCSSCEDWRGMTGTLVVE
jgi:protein-disulfide isomerase